jgi:hypothetical protein
MKSTAHPMHELFIFSKNYYSANVQFTLSGGPIDDANGHAGPCVRPEDEKQPASSRRDQKKQRLLIRKKTVWTQPLHPRTATSSKAVAE